jgi:hypothetical protein
MFAAAMQWVRFRVEPEQTLSSLSNWICSTWHHHSAIWQDSAGPYARCLDCGRRVPSHHPLSPSSAE